MRGSNSRHLRCKRDYGAPKGLNYNKNRFPLNTSIYAEFSVLLGDFGKQNRPALTLKTGRRIRSVMAENPLFQAHVTHVEVRCCKCKRIARLERHDVPEGLTVESLTDRARCQECGEGLPDVTQFPKPKSRW